MQKKRKIGFKRDSNEIGITLIALIITIIVLLILAGVTISALSGNNGTLTNASKAKISSELSEYKEKIELYKTEKVAENSDFNSETLVAGKESLRYNTQPEGETGNIKTIIPEISNKWYDKVEVVKGKMVLNTTDKTEISIAQSLGISPNPYTIIDGELTSSDNNLALMDKDGTVTIPDSVTSIGEGAFSGLDGLRTVIIPETVKEIGANAFSNNTTLEKVIIQDGVERIGQNAFSGCNNLKDISMTDSIVSIGASAFQDCSKLEELKLSNNINRLEGSTFWGCTNLKNINIPSNLEYIGISVFYVCKSLNNIELPSTVKEIGWAAFTGCSSLTDMKIDQNNNYYKIEDGIIYTKDGTMIVNVNPNGITGTTFTIKEGVKSVLSRAFSLCSKVETINIPSTITSGITGDFFNGMSSLKNINISKENPNYISENNFVYSKDYQELCYALSQDTTININENVKIVKVMAFVGCKKIKTLNITDNVETIEGWAFGGKTLEEINIGKKVKSLAPDFIISVRSSLREVNIHPENQYFTSDENFIYNKDKTKIITYIKNQSQQIIPEGVLEIGAKAFYSNGSYFQSIQLPSSLKIIGTNAFRDCQKLETINIPNSIEKIETNAFSNCANLREINIDKAENEISGIPWGAPKGERIVKWIKD